MSQITDAEIERLRGRLGSIVNSREAPYLTEITRDAIRHWAWATGDRNPLYLDTAYAQAAGHADVIGPPAMLYACSRNSVGYRGGLPGVHSAFGGSLWKWHRPLSRGTEVSTTTRFTGLTDLPSRFAGRMMKQVSETQFNDQDDRLVADVQSWCLRFERAAARERNPSTEQPEKTEKPVQADLPRLSAERIAEITEAYRVEEATVRQAPDWHSIQVGTQIPSMIRGPYSSTCAVAFEQAWGGSFIWAHGYWYEFLSRHPGASMRNQEGVPEAAEAVHWDARAARRAGVASSYDFGPERVAWMATLVTNWAGPAAFLSELYCEVRKFNLSGNLTRCTGRVQSKEEANGQGLIRIELQAVDLNGDITASGWATLRLAL